jgi:hypothetical protein
MNTPARVGCSARAFRTVVSRVQTGASAIRRKPMIQPMSTLRPSPYAPVALRYANALSRKAKEGTPPATRPSGTQAERDACAATDTSTTTISTSVAG